MLQYGARTESHLDGSRTKNGLAAEQPLPLSLAAELLPWLASKPPGSPVFALPKKTAPMLHADLRHAASSRWTLKEGLSIPIRSDTATSLHWLEPVFPSR